MNTQATMSHVGINVPDIAAAVKWYSDVFGCTVLAQPGRSKVDNSHFGRLVGEFFGEGFGSMLQAHLVTADGAGIELFQFEKPATVVPDNTFEYWRAGIFHFGLSTSDVEGVAKRISESGGKMLSKVWKLYANKPYVAVYCQDPWGTVIELYNASYEQYWSNMEPFEYIED